MDERLLCRIWQAQRFDRTALRTTRGEAVEVVYRGRAHRSPGPDFQGAMLVLAGELRHGDVEVHVRSSDWATHRHGRDHRYDAVLLHVVFREDPSGPTRTALGAEVPCLALGDRLDDADGWASLARLGEEECRPRVAALSDADLGARLDRLGDERLLQKAAALEADLAVADPEQVCYERLMEALGYSQNRRPFLELGRRLPLASLYALAHRHSPPERAALCQALLFGVAGLLPSQRDLGVPLDWASAEQADELERAWAAYGGEWRSEAMGAESWNLGVRPLNCPPRRLAAMSHLLGAHLDPGPFQMVLDELAAEEAALAARRLAATLAVEAPDSYWAGYFDFGRPIGPRPASLVGPQRALDAVVNVCLPLALAHSASRGDGRTASAARAAYRAAPRLSENEVTRWVVSEVLGRERGRIVSTACRQQGLHQLYRVGCDQRRCDGCPLLGAG